MDKIKQYRLISGIDPDSLEHEISDLLSKNWQPWGQASIKNRFYQIMVCYEDDLKDTYTLEDILRLYQIGRSTVWQKVKTGEIPKPAKKEGKLAIWDKKEIDKKLKRIKK